MTKSKSPEYTILCSPVGNRKPFYGEVWKSETDSKFYFHVKSRNHKVVFPSQSYKDRRSVVKLFVKTGWELRWLLKDPNHEFNARPKDKGMLT